MLVAGRAEADGEITGPSGVLLAWLTGRATWSGGYRRGRATELRPGCATGGGYVPASPEPPEARP